MADTEFPERQDSSTAAAELKWTPAGKEFMRGPRVDHKSKIT